MADKKRLIDANALKEKAEPEEVTGEGIVYVQDIDEAPTVDAVEVVRCKDCKFYELKYYTDGRKRMCCDNSKAIWTATPPDAFCSYGERKDNE